MFLDFFVKNDTDTVENQINYLFPPPGGGGGGEGGWGGGGGEEGERGRRGDDFESEHKYVVCFLDFF